MIVIRHISAPPDPEDEAVLPNLWEWDAERQTVTASVRVAIGAPLVTVEIPVCGGTPREGAFVMQRLNAEIFQINPKRVTSVDGRLGLTTSAYHEDLALAPVLLINTPPDVSAQICKAL